MKAWWVLANKYPRERSQIVGSYREVREDWKLESGFKSGEVGVGVAAAGSTASA